MRISMLQHDGNRFLSLVSPDGDYFLLKDIAPHLPASLEEVLNTGGIEALLELRPMDSHARRLEDGWVHERIVSRPGKVLGVGLNFAPHARDLDADQPEKPALFVKLLHTLIGPGEPIVLPSDVGRITAEAELALIVGAECHNVDPEDALACVAGAVVVLDQTAEDILHRNPRFLDWSKNYPSFLSVGSDLVTMDELGRRMGDLESVPIETRGPNGTVRSGLVSMMLHSPAAIVSFVSKIMPLSPGDLICTGTPGALAIEDGDEVEAWVGGIGSLRNPVIGQYRGT